MEKETFTPEPIATDWRSYNHALKAWKDYTDTASDLYDWILSFLNRDSLRVTDFLTLISLEPDQVIVKLFELSGRAPKGFELSQLVKQKLISNKFQSETLAALDAYNIARHKAEGLFKYDITRLFHKEEFFDLTEEFKSDLELHFTTFTRSPIQNEALEQINKLTAVCNWFAKHGVAKPRIGRRGIDQVLMAVRSSDDHLSFVPNLDVFKLRYWQQTLK